MKTILELIKEQITLAHMSKGNSLYKIWKGDRRHAETLIKCATLSGQEYYINSVGNLALRKMKG